MQFGELVESRVDFKSLWKEGGVAPALTEPGGSFHHWGVRLVLTHVWNVADEGGGTGSDRSGDGRGSRCSWSSAGPHRRLDLNAGGYRKPADPGQQGGDAGPPKLSRPRGEASTHTWAPPLKAIAAVEAGNLLEILSEREGSLNDRYSRVSPACGVPDIPTP